MEDGLFSLRLKGRSRRSRRRWQGVKYKCFESLPTQSFELILLHTQTLFKAFSFCPILLCCHIIFICVSCLFVVFIQGFIQKKYIIDSRNSLFLFPFAEIISFEVIKNQFDFTYLKQIQV